MLEGIFMYPYPKLMAPWLAVNHLFEIEPEPVQTLSEKLNKMIEVQPPSSHIGLAPVRCRLMSLNKRRGMVRINSANLSI